MKKTKKKAGAGHAKKLRSGNSLKKSQTLVNPQPLPPVLPCEADALFGKRGTF